MHRLLWTLTFLFFGSLAAFSQSVNGIPISEIDVEYVQIVGTSKLLSKKVKIRLDFGQVDKMFTSKDTQVTDADGRPTSFNSMIDALNFMSENGYEFVNAYAMTNENQMVYHYMLKKRKE